MLFLFFPLFPYSRCSFHRWYHLRHGDFAFDKNVYPTEDAYFDALAVSVSFFPLKSFQLTALDMQAAYREELASLYQAGCRNAQYDDPLLAYFCSTDMLSGMKEEGIDSAALLDKYIKLYNDCIRDVPADMTIGLHLCRGNFKDGSTSPFLFFSLLLSPRSLPSLPSSGLLPPLRSRASLRRLSPPLIDP